MIVKDFRGDFYDLIKNERLLIFVAFDVDALCASRILQNLLQCDHVVYTLIPVSGWKDIESSFAENCEGVRHVIMINCGGSVDIQELLQPQDDVVFYICDSHRPVDVCNVYNAVQVRLLMKESDVTDVPEYDEVFRDDESDEDSDNPDHESDVRHFDLSSLDRKREKRLWNERRTKVLFDYSQFCYHGLSSALIIYELAARMSMDTNELLWLAIVGVTDQYFHYSVPREKYFEQVMSLQSHVSRHNHRKDNEDGEISINYLRIKFEEELHLFLYRHSSLFDSLRYSINTACGFRLWAQRGMKKLHEFLAEMGVPISQCKQRFQLMEPSIKNHIKSLMMRQMTKYSLSSHDLVFPSFIAQRGYRQKICASDLTLACAATLETVESTKNSSDFFLCASMVLQRQNDDMLHKAIELAKFQLHIMMSQVQSFLDLHQIVSAGPYLYTFIQEGSPHVKYFSKSRCLTRLAHYTLEAYCSMSRNKRARSLPLVLAAPLDVELGTLAVIGIPPLELEDRKNFFGKAFEQAAISTKSRLRADFFDSNIIELKTEDKSRFFDALILLLQ